MKNDTYLHCECGDLIDHIIAIGYDEELGDFIFYTTMNHYPPWYKRVGKAIGYIFSSQQITHVETVCSHVQAR